MLPLKGSELFGASSGYPFLDILSIGLYQHLSSERPDLLGPLSLGPISATSIPGACQQRQVFHSKNAKWIHRYGVRW